MSGNGAIFRLGKCNRELICPMAQFTNVGIDMFEFIHIEEGSGPPGEVAA